MPAAGAVYKYIRMERKSTSALGRPRSIDRNKVLDAAEAVVAETGAAGLTIDAVAKAAGITKGGVQYCFGTKEGLIKAMLDRWSESFDREVAARAGGSTDPLDHVRAYVEASRSADEAENSRSAVMLATLVQNSHQLADTRDWYRRQIGRVDPATEAGRKARLAFLASEGVFFLRSFRFLDLPEEEWQAIFEDIEKLLQRSDQDEA